MLWTHPVEIKHNLKTMARKFKKMGKEVDKGIIRALNRTNTTMRTRARNELAAITGLKKKQVGEHITHKKAGRDFVSTIYVRGKALNIYRFAARESRRGVKASPWGKRREFKGAFIVKNRTVLVRTSKARLPIKPLFGPSIKREFTKKVNTPSFKKASGDRYKKLFYAEMKYRKGKVFSKRKL